MRDYLSLLREKAKTGSIKQHGIKGMRWGIRRTDSQIAKDTVARKSSGDPVTDTAKAKQAHATAAAKPGIGGETSAQRYSRLAGEAKGGGQNNWSQEDLNFFNSRTEAINKVNKMFEQKPGWLSTTSKTVLQKTAQRTMQDIANGVTNKYITVPVLDAIEPKKK